MKTTALTLFGVSVLLFFIGISMQNPKKMNEGLYQAHNVLERMALRKDSSEELKKAVLAQRIYMSDAETTRQLGRPLLWFGVAATLGGMLAVVLGWKKRPAPAV